MGQSRRGLLKAAKAEHFCKFGKLLFRQRPGSFIQVGLLQTHEPRAVDAVLPSEPNSHDAGGKPFLAADGQFDRDARNVRVDGWYDVDRAKLSLVTR